MRLGTLFRRLFTLILVAAIFAGVYYAIAMNDYQRRLELFHFQSTLAVQTAVRYALYDATRTLEAPISQFRYVVIPEGETLLAYAERYNTTVEAIRMANRLLPSVDVGSGVPVIIPENVQNLIPPRTFGEPHRAVDGDTLEALAARFGLPLDILQADNPVLAQRGIIPGDLVYIAQLL